MSTSNQSFKRSIKCFDCGAMVSGSIKDHHAVCTQNRKSKSVVLPAHIANQSNQSHNSAPRVRGNVNENDLKLVQRLRTDQRVQKDYSSTQDIYFILDVSGSMDGKKLNDAKLSLTKMVDEIDPEDRMAIITFDSQAFFKLKPRSAEQIIRQGELQGTLDKIFARGSTALYDAVMLAIDQLHDKSRKIILNVLTDGQDNASKITYSQLLKALEEYPNIVLNIIHIDDAGTSVSQYKTLCETRGDYMVINAESVFEQYIMIFRKYYKSKKNPQTVTVTEVVD